MEGAWDATVVIQAREGGHWTQLPEGREQGDRFAGRAENFTCQGLRGGGQGTEGFRMATRCCGRSHRDLWLLLLAGTGKAKGRTRLCVVPFCFHRGSN